MPGTGGKAPSEVLWRSQCGTPGQELFALPHQTGLGWSSEDGREKAGERRKRNPSKAGIQIRKKKIKKGPSVGQLLQHTL